MFRNVTKPSISGDNFHFLTFPNPRKFSEGALFDDNRTFFFLSDAGSETLRRRTQKPAPRSYAVTTQQVGAIVTQRGSYDHSKAR